MGKKKIKPATKTRDWKKSLFTSRFIPLIACFLLLGLAYVIVRMKNVEQDYALHQLRLETSRLEKKLRTLKTEQAKLLSVQNLRQWSKENNLVVPGPERMLVIPKQR